jgi:hypothetical protein
MTLDIMNEYARSNVMATAQLEDRRQEATHRQEEDRLMCRWNSQQTPTFPLPLGLVSPKYPKRQVSIGHKTSSPEGLTEEMESVEYVPPMPPPCPLMGSIADNSYLPKLPMRKSSVGLSLADSTHALHLQPHIPSFSCPLKAASHPPVHPIRLHAAGTTRSRQEYRASPGASVSPKRRVDASLAA